MTHKIKLKVKQIAHKSVGSNTYIVSNIQRLVALLYQRFDECSFTDSILSINAKALTDKYENEYLLIIKTKTAKWVAIELIWALFTALSIQYEFEILELK